MSINLEKLSINIDQQSTLAKLLAQENVHVIHGNYRTAWFDPEKRVLALPIWKNRGKAVYDLLTGHEVGHALFTPAQGWHDAVDDIEGAPKAYLNVLEDVRIERKVQDKYPGLRSQFKKAYKQLAEEDFFGLSSLNGDFSSIMLIDKINIKSKLGENVEVEFDEIEQDFYNQAFKNETFEDVVLLAKKIYEYQKSLYEKTKPLDIPDLDDLELASNASDNPSNDYEKPIDSETKNNEASEETTETEESEDVQPNSFKQSTKADESEQKPSEHTEGIKSPPQTEKLEETHDVFEDILDAMTDKAFREKEKDLTVSDELSSSMVYTLNKVKDKDVIIDYKTYYAQWQKELDELVDWRAEYVRDGLNYLSNDYKKFKKETEQAAAYMAKEFELRKAAYQYSRSSIHKTGLLNTTKLHAYKYSEDIFLKATKLANYKNHGMMMFIDFSGSMSENIGPTIRQILNLTMFCRMANIPYEVYAFTTRVHSDESTDYSRENWKNYFDCEVIHQKFNLLNLLSSRMSRSEYQHGFHSLWHLSMCWDNKLTNAYINAWNQLHSTPLNTCIAYANDLIKQFKSKHNIEKMIAMFLTDGASDTFQIRMTEEGEKQRIVPRSSWRHRDSILRFDGQTLNVGHINSSKVTEQLLQAVKRSTGTVMLGFYISQYRSDAVSRVCDRTGYANRDKYSDQLNKNRAVIVDNVFGYDRYFGLCTKYLDVVENELGEMVEDGASKGKLKSAFAKMTKSKRVNRVLLNAFVDSIA